MNYEQWKRMLSAVNEKEDLSKDNVIDKIKEELKKYPEEYKKWEEAGFDVDYLFKIKDDILIAYDRFTLLHFTLLHLAALCGYEKIVNLLIENDASVDVEYKGMTPLHCAAIKGHTEIVEILVKTGRRLMQRLM